ncbi:hypothetical protein [uncultured Bifidobacterium sp.]|uniref:hypothetical protein n=1 Tax=uncultured Bifidobacterium sp. TaxID=165187 RepID=UPI0025908D92|nr:hypothetical protein [uncultured Bifidobacterium sp.]
MSLKTITCYALECDWCHRRIPDRGSGLIGWDTVDGINAELQDTYEQWGVTEDGRHCCTDCLNVTDDDRYATPDGLEAEPLDAITMPDNEKEETR